MLLKTRWLKSPCSPAQTLRQARGRVSLPPLLWCLLGCPSYWLSIEKQFVLERLVLHTLAMKKWALCSHLNSQVSLKWTWKAGRKIQAQELSKLRSMKALSKCAYVPFDRWEGCPHFLLSKAFPECLWLWTMKKKKTCKGKWQERERAKSYEDPELFWVCWEKWDAQWTCPRILHTGKLGQRCQQWLCLWYWSQWGT